MAQNYYWSPSKLAFYPVAIKSIYIKAGTFPDDAVLVDDSVFSEYGAVQQPTGKIRGADTDGMPTWVSSEVTS